MAGAACSCDEDGCEELGSAFDVIMTEGGLEAIVRVGVVVDDDAEKVGRCVRPVGRGPGGMRGEG